MNSASEIDQHETATVLSVIDGVNNISDDIIVHGTDQPTHDRRLHEVLQQLHDSELTLNPDSTDSFVFLGMLLTEKAIEPTREGVRAKYGC